MSSHGRLAVGKRIRKGWLALGLIVSLILLGIGIALLSDREKTPAAILIGLGGIGLLVMIGWAVSVKRQWREIEVLDDGFRIFDRTGEAEYADAEVVCMSLLSKRNFVNGDLKTITRTLDLWVDDPGSPRGMTLVQLLSTYPPQEPDPLTDFINRIGDKLYAEAERKLAGGEEVNGEGWTVERSTLYVAGKRDSQEVPFRDLEALALVDDHVCIWVGDEESPSIKLPQSQANSYILQRIVNEELAKRPEKPEDASKQGLGRIIFERAPGKSNTIVAWIGLVGCVLGVLLFVGGVASGTEGLMIGGLVTAVVSALIALAAKLTNIAFRAHERGVSIVKGRKTTSMRYEHVDSLTWSATRMYYNGAYTGTALQIKFLSNHGEDVPEKLAYSRNINGLDDELDNLRDHISDVIAVRLYQRYQEGQTVPWTKYMQLTPQGIAHQPAGFVGRKEPVLVSFDDIVNFGLDQGVLHIWRRGEKKSSLNEQVNQENFFPGFRVFCQIMQDRWQQQ